MRPIDKFLNSITMYRLLLYGLALLLGIAAFLGYSGVIAISGNSIVALSTVLVVTSYVTNKLLGNAFRAATNSESYLITALILSCILPPTTSLTKLGYAALAAVIAISSKFIISYHHKHIFNPAAIGAVAVNLLGLLSITWWVGNPDLLPFIAVLGLLVVRKIKRSRLFIAFLTASLLMMVIVSIVSGQPAIAVIKTSILSGPLIFFATIMLTEPATMPSTQYYQILFGLLVGTAYASQLYSDFLHTNASPQLVLIAGNIFAYAINHKVTFKLKLKHKVQISDQVYDYVFMPDRKMEFAPGQYLEWTLKHKKVDGRGNRRSFTIASSPTERDVHLGVKFYDPPSSFKRALGAMRRGDTITAGQLSGNFTLPADPNIPLVFIAGGVGITPFRSMLKYLIDINERRLITLFYIVSKPEEFAYIGILKDAQNIGLSVVPIVSGITIKKSRNRRAFTIALLSKNVPNYIDNTYLISGPNGLVESYRTLLKEAGVPGRQIVTDYFSGY